MTAPIPASGPPTSEGDPETGEWSGTRGEGLWLLPLWEGKWLTGVYGEDWNAAEEEAESHLTALATELDARWGRHRTVSMRVPLLRSTTGTPLPEPYRTLAATDCYGDLRVWGPLHEPTTPATPRWLSLSLNQSDGDAPVIITALITTYPIEELPDPA
ncbi:hypothetical protein N4P33_03410 [Streptomyces sp. 15-116A]|uniref:hypothetical protein n=1 Tax=Streptomyces sp. 15-116A TaxID=2259035 RepID=UPI0021B3BA8B|nr:hypothetical protein [Streptomyces sp. 15-116A]MCT7351218.1 hypothetical protein [Streptomyces sp. 15-116A]